MVEHGFLLPSSLPCSSLPPFYLTFRSSPLPPSFLHSSLTLDGFVCLCVCVCLEIIPVFPAKIWAKGVFGIRGAYIEREMDTH